MASPKKSLKFGVDSNIFHTTVNTSNIFHTTVNTEKQQLNTKVLQLLMLFQQK